MINDEYFEKRCNLTEAQEYDDGGITWFTKGGGFSNKYITFPYTPTEMYLLCDEERNVITKPITELAVGDKVVHWEQGYYKVHDIKDDMVTVVAGSKPSLVLPITDFIGPDVVRHFTYNAHVYKDGVKEIVTRTVPYTTWFKPDEYVEEPIDAEECSNLKLSTSVISDETDDECNPTTYVDEYTITNTVLADREALITAFADFVRSLDDSHPLILSMVTKDENDNTQFVTLTEGDVTFKSMKFIGGNQAMLYGELVNRLLIIPHTQTNGVFLNTDYDESGFFITTDKPEVNESE